MATQHERPRGASGERRTAGDGHDGIRKTAILIDSVDQPTAEILFGQISFEFAAQVRTALLELGDVDPQERAQVLAEFLDAGLGAHLDVSEAEDVQAADPSSAAEGFADVAAEARVPAAEVPRSVVLEPPQLEAPTAALARGLAQEHAQTICLVLANLPPPQAADLLQRLPPARQTEVLQRLTQLEAAPPEVLRDVGDELQPWGLSAPALMPEDSGRSPRFESGLLASGANDAPPWRAMPPAAADGRQRSTACRAEAADAPPLAEFDDLVRLDDAALARVFGAAAPEIVLLALSGANRDLIDRIVCRLPASAGRTLRRQIETLGPTRLRDIEAAQQQLAELAGQMCRDGLIHFPNRRRFTMAA